MAAAAFPRVRTITPTAEILFFVLICIAAAIWWWASSHQRKPWQWTTPMKQPAWDTTYERPKPMPPAQPVIQRPPAAVPTPTRTVMKPPPVCNLMCRERELGQERYWLAVRAPLGPDEQNLRQLPQVYQPAAVPTAMWGTR
jgi:hypothetical protein